jgi:hypothetical protein
VADGVCSTGYTLETCSVGSIRDAQCIPCTNPIPTNASYNSPSPSNFNQCPYACATGLVEYAPLRACLACKDIEKIICGLGQKLVGCNAALGTLGICAACEQVNNITESYFWLQGANTSCTYLCAQGFYRTLSGLCVPQLSNICNGEEGTYIVQDSNNVFQCANCPNKPLVLLGALNQSAYYVNPGITCDWLCRAGKFRVGDTHCQECTPLSSKCTTGKYQTQICKDFVDNNCAACDAFPASQAHIAFYFPQVIANEWDQSSMCNWGCTTGFYRTSVTSSVCERCPQPWDSAFVAKGLDAQPYNVQSQCATTCNAGKYKGVLGDSIPDPRSIVCDGSIVQCQEFAGCTRELSNAKFLGETIQEYTTSCNAYNQAECVPAHYTTRKLLENLQLSPTTLDSLAVESDGTIIYVARDHVIEAWSPLTDNTTSQGFFIAGSFTQDGYADTLYDGREALFGTIHCLKLLYSSRSQRKYLLVGEQNYPNIGGMIRVVNLDNMKFPGFSITSPAPAYSCSPSSIVSVHALDVIHEQGVGTTFDRHYIAFSDKNCGTVQVVNFTISAAGTFQVNSKHIMLGTPGQVSSNTDGLCSSSTSFTKPVTGIAWDTTEKLWLTTEDANPSTSSMYLRLVTNPLNKDLCQVQTIANMGYTLDYASIMSNLALLQADIVLFTFSNTLWKWNHTASQLSQIASKPKVQGYSVAEGPSCLSQMDSITSIAYTRKPSEHAVYLADRASSILWRVSMPCPEGSYWIKDGVCIPFASVSNNYCRDCDVSEPQCSRDFCFNIKACGSYTNTQLIQCTNKPGSNAYYTSPLPNSSTFTECVYECNEGYYSAACLPCNTSVCGEPGIYRSPCGGKLDPDGSVCAQKCSNVSGGANNFYWTSGGGMLDNCDFACYEGFFKNTAARQCQACTPMQNISCPGGQYVTPCNATADTRCQPCNTSNIVTSSIIWGSNCQVLCTIGEYLRNSSGILECRNCIVPYGIDGSGVDFTGSGTVNNATSCPYVLLEAPGTTTSQKTTTTLSGTTSAAALITTTSNSMTTTSSTTSSRTSTSTTFTTTNPQFTTTPAPMFTNHTNATNSTNMTNSTNSTSGTPPRGFPGTSPNVNFSSEARSNHVLSKRSLLVLGLHSLFLVMIVTSMVTS